MQPKRLATLFVSRLQHLRQVSVLFFSSLFFSFYYYYFYAVWRFGFRFLFCFVFFLYFQQIWSDVATVGGVEVQPNEWHPQRLMSLMVLLAKCRQTLAELIRIRIEVRVRVRISWIVAIQCDWMNTRTLVSLLHRLISHCCVDEVVFWPFSGQPAGDFWPLITVVCSVALVFIIFIIFYWYAICQRLAKVQGFEIKK